MNMRVVAAVTVVALAAVASFGQDTVEKQPKIVLLIDVSASMSTIDGPAKPGVDPTTLPSRHEQVVEFLTGKHAFLARLLKKANVSAYRFGSGLDDVVDFEPGKTWTAEQWRAWLKPKDRTGTNIAAAASQMHRNEKDSYLQAIIIVSDGHSNKTTKGDIEDFLAEVQDPDRPIPVFAVGVGSRESLPSIRITNVYAPEHVRPGERFPVRVETTGIGLEGEEFQVLLEAQRVKDADAKPVMREKFYIPGPITAKFHKDKPTVVTFDIDLDKLKPTGDSEGTWHFTARVPSHRREAVAGVEHVSDAAPVVVQNRKLRVLLFAHGASREYQFLRTLLFREAREKRLDLSILLQSGKDEKIDQQVGADRLLKQFPDKIESLREFDVIVAFDPDWTALTTNQRELLNKWCGEHAGGIIFSAGPLHTHQLARPGGHDFSKLLPLLPVVLRDNRLHTSGLGLDSTRPYALNLTPDAEKYPFLKLDAKSDSPTAGWNTFFWNDEKAKPAARQKPRRGFFNHYPVERLKPASGVVATFAGPKESRIGDRTDAFKDQQPFIVTMPYGVGRTAYLGSGEFWRLRQAKEAYHERFWLELIRHVAAGGTTRPSSVRLVGQNQADTDRELSDTSVDFAHLYELAGPSEPLVSKLPANVREDVESALRASVEFPRGRKDRLFFRLDAADALPLLLPKLPAKRFPKIDLPKEDDPFRSPFDKRMAKVLVIDGDGVKGQLDGGDSYHIEHAIGSIPGKAYEVTFAKELSVKALESADLANFGAILLLNVRDLSAVQLGNLQKFSKAGGGVAFFLGPNVSTRFYDESLYRAGKGIFPVPLDKTYFPRPEEKALKGDDAPMLLRDDLFPEFERYPIFGEVFSNPSMRLCLGEFPVRRYFKVPRDKWRLEPGRSLELATLPNHAAATTFADAVVSSTRGPAVTKVFTAQKFASHRHAWNRHLERIETTVRNGSDKKGFHLAGALDDLLLDRDLKDFWRADDPNVRITLNKLVRLRHEARHGDPLVIGSKFGKGRVVAVLTTAGRQWNDFAAGSVASVAYPPFIWEMLNYLTRQDRDTQSPRKVRPRADRAPQLLDIGLAYEPMRGYTGKKPLKELAQAYLVTPDASIPFRGVIADDAGLRSAHWVVEIMPIDALAKKTAKAQTPLRIPLLRFQDRQDQRALDELTRDVLAGVKDKPFPGGFAKTHDLAEEPPIDFRRHLAGLKPKTDGPQGCYLVRLWLETTGINDKTVRSAPFLFLVVSENELLSRAYRAADKAVERLESAREKIQAAQVSLDDQLLRMKRPDADLPAIALRISELQRLLQTSSQQSSEAAQMYAHTVIELEVNRVSRSHVERAQTIASSLQDVNRPGLGAYRQADNAVHSLLALLEMKKKDASDAQARVTQKKIKALDTQLTQALDQLSEGLVEAKLIDLLLHIERQQAQNRAELDRLLEDVVKDLIEKKK